MKTKIYSTIILLLVFVWNAKAQTYDDYIGAGHDNGIIVTSSDEFENSKAQNTMNGSGMDAALMEAARFLSHTTFGANMAEVENLNNMGMEAWMEQQFNTSPGFLLPKIDPLWETIKQKHLDAFPARLAEAVLNLCEDDPNYTFTQQQVEDYYEQYITDIFGPYALHFNYAWWHNMITSEDQLRQRVAYALSQLLVVSSQSDLGDFGHSLAAYYDILIKHSFGNYKDLLMEVTMSPAMGYYLSHLNNPKANPDENVHPDENYAREIMQLFTIGLYELNQDGSRKKDMNGNDIPTYSNDDIKELAKVFTGLGPGELDPNMDIWWATEPYFGLDFYGAHKWEPMKMYQDYHEEEAKLLLGDLVIPAGQDGLSDIEMAVDYLFNHPNVGPFVSRLLIQRLVKSNPTPEYISRVSSIFNNNGNGVRGDLQSVVQAIIMDEEARSCSGLLDPDNGKLREPTLRHSLYTKAIPMMGRRSIYNVDIQSYDCAGIQYEETSEDVTEDLKYWHNGYSNYELLRQNTLQSPTVFNFYLPDHQPVGEMTNRGLVGPEYKIHDSGTSINYINLVLTSILYEFNLYSYDGQIGIEYIVPDFSSIEGMAENDPEELLNYLDILLTHGQLSDETRENLRSLTDVLVLFNEPNLTTKLILYFVMISPDFVVLK